jgi:hypothetical protein
MPGRNLGSQAASSLLHLCIFLHIHAKKIPIIGAAYAVCKV